MAILVNCIDPLGNTIILRDNRYRTHIEWRHEGFTLDDIQIAVENPDVITRDVNDALINLYYRTDRYDSDGDPEVLKVCVRYRSDVGEITSAYLARGVKREEIEIWARR